MTVKTKSNEIRIHRVYDAPVQAVWDAWTDPKQAEKWWGPRGFTITTHSKDLRPGGHWTYTMHGPDGTDYPNKALYYEVERYSKLVYDHGASDDRPALFRVTVTFEEKNGKTVMDMTMALATPQAAEETRQFIRKAGGNATWDRLAEYLGKENGKDIFVINRSFPVSVEKMYELWTKSELFSRWLPPTGFTMEFLKADIRPGGKSFYKLTGNNLTMYGTVSYISFEAPQKIVYSQQFADEKGNVARHPMAPTWPETMLTTVLLAPEGAGVTRVTVTWEPSGKASAAELETFLKSRAGMAQGWTGSFDKLESLVEKL